MGRRVSLHQRGLREALSLRRRLQILTHESVDPFDAAARLGVDVWFQDVPSLEGIYVKEPPTIVIGSQRPPGRRVYTCAHELGHHVFGHGANLKGASAGAAAKGSYDERLVDVFAGYFLMPKLAVQRAVAVRGLTLSALSPADVLTLASHFGVGYRSILHHLRQALRLVPRPQAEALGKILPVHAKASVLGPSFDPAHHLVVVDGHWGRRPIDVEVGDLLAFDVPPVLTGQGLRMMGAGRSGHCIYEAVRVGVDAMRSGGSRPLVLRVAPRAFSGRHLYRFTPEGADIDPSRLAPLRPPAVEGAVRSLSLADPTKSRS